MSEREAELGRGGERESGRVRSGVAGSERARERAGVSDAGCGDRARRGVSERAGGK